MTPYSLIDNQRVLSTKLTLSWLQLLLNYTCIVHLSDKVHLKLSLERLSAFYITLHTKRYNTVNHNDESDGYKYKFFKN